MKVRIFQHAISAAGKPAFEAFVRGCRACGDDVEWSKNIEEKCDIAVHASGVKGGRLRDGHMSKARARLIERFGKRRVVIESPVIRPGRKDLMYWRLSLGGFLRDEADYANQNSPSDRWDMIAKEQSIEQVPFHVPDRGWVLVMLQKTSDASLRGKDMIEWGREMIAEIKEHVNWPILIRPHPLETIHPPDFDGARLSHGHDSDWTGARAVVTYTSLSSIDAMLKGLPTWTMHQGNMAYPVANTELRFLKDPTFPDPDNYHQWLWDLAYTQWLVPEIESGVPWKRLKEMIQ